jgi:hypothetical protein
MAIRMVIVALWASLWAGPASAQQKGVLGIGAAFGEPTGVSVKYFVGDDKAFAGAVGYAPLGDGLHVHTDFHWHPIVLETGKTFAVPLYLGVGLRALRRDQRAMTPRHLRFGARGVVGFMFDFTRLPFDVFAEFAGIAELRSKGGTFGLALNANLGVRYYF